MKTAVVRNEYPGMSMYETVDRHLHREDGPALIGPLFDGWFIQGKNHREDGPALMSLRKDCSIMEAWYVNGIDISDEVMSWIEDAGINPNWSEWTGEEKMHFRLRFV